MRLFDQPAAKIPANRLNMPMTPQSVSVSRSSRKTTKNAIQAQATKNITKQKRGVSVMPIYIGYGDQLNQSGPADFGGY